VDIVIEGRLVIELKTVDQLLPIHEAQLLTYLRLGGFPTGLLLNFHAAVLKDGNKRMVF
jgi:GxxExxY protein